VLPSGIAILGKSQQLISRTGELAVPLNSERDDCGIQATADVIAGDELGIDAVLIQAVMQWSDIGHLSQYCCLSTSQGRLKVQLFVKPTVVDVVDPKLVRLK
jgi:hypothetical protein